MAEPDKPAIRGIDDSYLLGDAVLVAPVLEEGAVRRLVYLPAGDWYDFWTNELIAGEREIEVMAPLERLPLFVRAGTVLPLWPDMQYVGEKTVETLLLRCYPGEHETVLYEDRGEGLGYQQGEYRWVYITTEWQDDTLVIERRAAGSYTPDYTAVRLEVVGLDDEPASVRLERQGAPLWFYDAGVLDLTVPTFQRIEVTRKPTTTDRTLLRKTW
jgi:alpha-glucosidase